MRFVVARAVLAAAVWTVAVPALAAGGLIEAETPFRRTSDAPDFASPYRDAWAFGRGAVLKFHLAGLCHYRVEMPETAEAEIWLRYAARQDQTLRYTVGPTMPDSDKGFSTSPLPGTGQLDGPDAWRWSRLGRATFRRGVNFITLRNAPIRLDCLWVAESGPPPERPAETAAPPETRKHLEHPIETVAPDWLAEADEYVLPQWYDAIRVCAHTRLSWPWLQKRPEAFLGAGQMLASVGFRSISRHIRSGSEAVWWPSAAGDVMPEARTRNFAKEIIDEAHAAGCRIIVYHRHMEDAAAAREHPQWRVIDVHGKPVSKRGPKVCLNSPYADVVQTRLVELAKMGADGFYFDEVHLEKPLCWCPACRQGFRAETGLDYPESNDPYHWVFQKAVEYKNVAMERLFRRWRAAVHAVNPDCVLLIGSNTWPAMNDRHFTHRLCRITDSMKTEFNLAARVGNNRIFSADRSLAMPETDARIVLGYALARDACDGRPAHVWTHNLPDPTAARFATAGIIAHGLIANLDVAESRLPERELLSDAVALGNRVAPAFAGRRPLRWALVHFSERSRDYYWPDEAEAWRQVLYPTYGAFTALLRARLPVGIITDSQLEQGRLEGCGVLFLPSSDQLTDAMRRALAQFEARGGLVIRQRPQWAWHETGGVARCSASFLEAVAKAALSPPVQATGGPEKMHLIGFRPADRARLTVALVNDFSWVQTGGKPQPPAPNHDAKPPARLSTEGEDQPTLGDGADGPPAPCRTVTVILRDQRRPSTVAELVTGRSLPVTGSSGRWTVQVPDFDCLAVLDVSFE